MTLYAGQRDVAERLLGRDASGSIAIEAERLKAPQWHLTVTEQVAGSPVGVIARFHLDESDGDGAEWLVEHQYAERLVEVLAHDDAAGLVALITQKITTEKKD